MFDEALFSWLYARNSLPLDHALGTATHDELMHREVTIIVNHMF